MPPTRAFYSVLQYMPDGGRAEAANVGVALFVPGESWLEVRTSPTLERVDRFFKPKAHDRQRIERAVSGLTYRLGLARSEFRSEADFAKFIAARADAVRLTPPRLVMVEDRTRDLSDLYDKLVGDREQLTVARSPTESLPPRVAEVVQRLEATHRVWRPREVSVPTVKRPLKVTFAYANGRVNYVRSESLAPSGRLTGRMHLLGFNGRLIHEHPVDGKSSALVVLSSNPQADPATEKAFHDALQDFDVRVVPFRETEAFATEVEETAH